MTTYAESRPTNLHEAGTANADTNRNWDRCPFCGAPSVEHKVAHSPACAQQVSLERLREDDDAWLTASAQHLRTRALQQAEIVEIALTHDRQAIGRVKVSRYSSGRFARQYDLARGGSLIVMDPHQVVIRDGRHR